MEKTIKYLCIINGLGHPLAALLFGIIISIHSFAWSPLLLAVILVTGTPFGIASYIFWRNRKQPNPKHIQLTFIGIMLILWLPSIGLPFAYELGGLIICLLLFGLGLWGVLLLKNPYNKMVLTLSIGIFFLSLSTLAVWGTLYEALS